MTVLLTTGFTPLESHAFGDVGPTSIIPPSGALFGAAISNGSAATFTALEAKAGRTLDYLRLYSHWNAPMPSYLLKWAVENGRIPLLSIDTTNMDGSFVPWTSIASGSQDASIIAQARALKALRVPILLSFEHEPEVAPPRDTPSEFVAAWRHYVDVFRAAGASNVRFVLILVSDTYASGLVSQYYPGDSYVDWVGADGYNYDQCGGNRLAWRSFATIFAGLNTFGIAHAKPVVIAEWASVEDPAQPGRKAQWISAAAATIEGWPQVKGASYFDAAGVNRSCNWLVGTSSSALDAWETMARDPYFNPRPQALLSAPRTTGAAPFAVAFNGSRSTGISSAIASWTLTFGDGSADARGSGRPPSEIDHTYTTGSFIATLTVVDKRGISDFATLGITAYPRPVVGTAWVSAQTTTGATLNGLLTAGGLDTYSFDYGRTTAYGGSTPAGNAGSARFPTVVTTPISGLSPGAEYHFRLEATNTAGTASTADAHFTAQR